MRLSDIALEAIRDFHLDEVLDRKPDELDFGQRRLVALARTVASDPDVLLLDEPAAGLSDHEAGELSALIHVLAKDWGMGVLVVEHNIDLVLGLCDRVTVLDTGCVLATGTPEEVRLNADVMSAYLGAEPGVKRARPIAESRPVSDPLRPRASVQQVGPARPKAVELYTSSTLSQEDTDE